MFKYVIALISLLSIYGVIFLIYYLESKPLNLIYG